MGENLSPLGAYIWHNWRQIYQTLWIVCSNILWDWTLGVALLYDGFHPTTCCHVSAGRASHRHSRRLVQHMNQTGLSETTLVVRWKGNSPLHIIEQFLLTAILINTKCCLQSINGGHTACFICFFIKQVSYDISRETKLLLLCMQLFSASQHAVVTHWQTTAKIAYLTWPGCSIYVAVSCMLHENFCRPHSPSP